MYQLQSQEISAYVESDSRTFRAVMEFVDGTILENEIVKLSIDAQTANQDIKAGDTISRGITAELTGLTSDLSGKTFLLYLYAVNLFTELPKELIPFGRYKVISCKRNGEKWTIEAKDGLYKSDGTYTSTLSYPTTTDNVELEICNKLGILPPRYDISQLTDKDGAPILTADGEEIYVRDSAPVVINAPLEECTYREMLGYCAALDSGKCAMIDREGHLIHKGWTDIDYTISAGRADEPETDDKDITITQIVCQVSEGKNLTITANPGRAMTFSNPYMTQDIMGNIASRYFYKPYRPLSIYHRLGDPRLDMLDVVTVVKADGTSYRVPIMSMSYSYDGGLSAKIAATGTPDADNKSDNSSPMMRKIKKIVADSISATEEKLRASFEEMADYIVGNEGGYVVTKFNADNQPIATYYTDNMDIEQAKEFLLINNHGIAGGTNGIHGPLNTAIDIQGRINATQILTGILSAIVIQSLNYDVNKKTGSKINLEDGTFSLGGGAMTFGNNLLKLIGCAIDNGKFRVDSDGNVIMTSANITNGNINCGSGKFRVDSVGNCTAKSFVLTDPSERYRITIDSNGIRLQCGSDTILLTEVDGHSYLSAGNGDINTNCVYANEFHSGSSDNIFYELTVTKGAYADDFYVKSVDGGYISIRDKLGI